MEEISVDFWVSPNHYCVMELAADIASVVSTLLAVTLVIGGLFKKKVVPTLRLI
jgi:hypothetical protein